MFFFPHISLVTVFTVYIIDKFNGSHLVNNQFLIFIVRNKNSSLFESIFKFEKKNPNVIRALI